MIEVTDGMVEAYLMSEDADGPGVEWHSDAVRRHLTAVLAIVERDRKAQIAEAAAAKRPTQEILDAYAEVAPSGQVSVWGVMAVMAIVEREQVAPLRAVLEKLLDPYACHYDHHGDCQEHGTTSQRPCPHARAKDLLGWSAP